MHHRGDPSRTSRPLAEARSGVLFSRPNPYPVRRNSRRRCLDRDRRPDCRRPRVARAATGTRRAAIGRPAAADRRRVRRPVHRARVIDLVARLERGRPVRLDDLAAALTPAISTGCSAARSWPTSCSSSRRTGWPTTGTRPASCSTRRPVRPDAHHRGFEPGRSVDRPPGRARGRRLPGARCRLQPPRSSDRR